MYHFFFSKFVCYTISRCGVIVFQWCSFSTFKIFCIFIFFILNICYTKWGRAIHFLIFCKKYYFSREKFWICAVTERIISLFLCILFKKKLDYFYSYNWSTCLFCIILINRTYDLIFFYDHHSKLFLIRTGKPRALFNPPKLRISQRCYSCVFSTAVESEDFLV